MNVSQLNSELNVLGMIGVRLLLKLSDMRCVGCDSMKWVVMWVGVGGVVLGLVVVCVGVGLVCMEVVEVV